MSTQVQVNETLFRIEMARNGFNKMVDFESASGIPRATIDNMLSGRNVPNQRTIQATFDALPKSKKEDLFAIFFRQNLHDTQEAHEKKEGEPDTGETQGQI